MKGLDLPIIVSFSFIFNVRVNPDNADNTVSIRHPSGKIVIPNDNFGFNSLIFDNARVVCIFDLWNFKTRLASQKDLIVKIH
jgi:hypothetical protein